LHGRAAFAPDRPVGKPRAFPESVIRQRNAFTPAARGQRRQDGSGRIPEETDGPIREEEVSSPRVQAPEMEGIALLVDSAHGKRTSIV